MSNFRYLPMTLGIIIIAVAFISTLNDDREEHAEREAVASAPAEPAVRMSLDKMRANNRKNLQTLTMGMTKAEATAAMGSRTFFQKNPDFIVPNPYRSESYQAPDGTRYELLSYYTDLNKEDYKLTQDEMTPLIIENGKLIGWGWTFFERLDLRHHAVGDMPPVDMPVEK